MGTPTPKPRRVDPELVFSLLFGAVVAAGIVASLGWPFGARLFPQVIGGAALLIIALRLVGRVLPSRRGAVGGAQGEILDLTTDDDLPPAEYYRRARRVGLWVIGFLVAAALVGLELAIPAYLFAYTRLVGHLRLWQAALVAAAVTGVVVGGFDGLLGIRLPEGMLR